MNYVKNFNFYGVEAKEIPCITGEGAPTETTEGAVGCLYMNANGNLYKCTSADGGVFVWEETVGQSYVDDALKNQSSVNYNAKYLHLDLTTKKKCIVNIPSNDTEIKLWHSGKNMLKKFAARTMGGITVSVDEDGTLTLDGTVSYGTGANTSFILTTASLDNIPFDKSKIYWASIWFDTPAPHTAGYIMFRVKNEDGVNFMSASVTASETSNYKWYQNTVAETTEKLSTGEIYLYNVPNGTVFDNWKLKVQLEQADSASGVYDVPSLVTYTLPVENGKATKEFAELSGYNYFTTNADVLNLSTTTQVPTQSWLGKRWAAFGDSITYKAADSTALRYHDIVAQELGLSVINYGRATTGYSTTGNVADGEFYTRMSNIAPDAFDFMTIMGSCNDFGVINRGEKELGTYTDTGTETVCGCINTTIDKFYELAPLKRLGIITMLPTYSYGPDLITKAPIAENYVNAVIQICKSRGIPCLDLYHCSGLRPWVAEVKNAFFHDGDGIHPNDKGVKFIAPLIREFVKSLI